MDEKKKKMVMLLGSVFVLIIFITSYAGSGGGVPASSNGNSSKNTTKTYYPAFGSANAVVVGYGNSTVIRIGNASAANSIIDMLSAMQANGAIISYSPIGEAVSVYLNRTNAYELQAALANELASNAIALSATEYVSLPSTVQLTPAGMKQTVPVYFLAKSYPMQKGSLEPLNSTIRVSISTEIAYSNGGYVPNINTTLRSG